MIVLGLHGGVTIRQHDAAAAILVDGRVAALCEEERYTRRKGSYGDLPDNAIRGCLDQAGISMADVGLLVSPGITYKDYKETLAEFLEHKFGHAPKIELVNHQMAHVAAAFYSSGRPEALCLSLDASGDGLSGLVAGASRRNGISQIREIHRSQSIGSFYTLLTHYLGFNDGDEYKVMGLAPYGKPDIDLSAIIRTTPDGWDLDGRFFRNRPAPSSPFEPTYSQNLIELLGHNRRLPGDLIEQFHKNLAASVQDTLEQCLLSLAVDMKKMDPQYKTLCFGGGVALNCRANQRLRESQIFDEIWVPPVSSDRGLALGCAYLGAQDVGDNPAPLHHAYLGTQYDTGKTREELEANGCSFREVSDPAETASQQIAKGHIIAVHQGRSEAGARALGHRSILALSGGQEIKDRVNSRIKYRESFRPFAPAVLHSQASDYFDIGEYASPYMCFTFNTVAEFQDSLGAVINIDGTARVQTVAPIDGCIFDKIICSVGRLTGNPVVLNTSFNLKGQPIVETPRDALMTFYGSGLDDLIIGPFHIEKDHGPRKGHE